MKDLGASKKILGMKITCDENGKKKRKKKALVILREVH